LTRSKAACDGKYTECRTPEGSFFLLVTVKQVADRGREVKRGLVVRP
jgi:hypothetical protein